VRDTVTDKTVCWDNNKAMTPQAFDALHADMLAHAKGMEIYAQDLYGGAWSAPWAA
jgi:phosphoenolpyruvate carboxykinase (ATP)